MVDRISIPPTGSTGGVNSPDPSSDVLRDLYNQFVSLNGYLSQGVDKIREEFTKDPNSAFCQGLKDTFYHLGEDLDRLDPKTRADLYKIVSPPGPDGRPGAEFFDIVKGAPDYNDEETGYNLGDLSIIYARQVNSGNYVTPWMDWKIPTALGVMQRYRGLPLYNGLVELTDPSRATPDNINSSLLAYLNSKMH